MSEENKVRIQDDLYTYINAEKLESIKIPDDRPTVGGFTDLDIGVEKIMMKEFKILGSDIKKADKELMRPAVEIYLSTLEAEKLKAEEGIKKLTPVLKNVLSIKKLDDFNKSMNYLYENGVRLPFEFGVSVNMKDTKKHILSLSSPSLILPDKDMYKDNPSGEQLLGVWGQMVKQLLSFLPKTMKIDIEDITSSALTFDKNLSNYVKSNVEWANYVECINIGPFEETADKIIGVEFKSFMKSIYGRTPKLIDVADPKYFKNFKKVFSEKTLHNYVSWAFVNYILSNVSYLGKKLRETGRIYTNTLYGVQKSPSSEKFAYRLASSIFSEPVGIYYGRKYFGEEAKKDVIRLVKGLISSYKKRLATNNWLSQETKDKAILKLNKMVLKMGYPDNVSDGFKAIKFSTKKGLFEAMNQIKTCKRNYEDSKLYEKVDRTLWAMPGHMVNACYDPSKNDITFPAAILQKPFYSLKQSPAENYGGIGAVIGHEISHAFDNNGASFDELGNLNNWWKKKDFEQFKKKTQEMIDEMDGLVVPNVSDVKVNGTLVVSESIADLGGMASALETMEADGNPDYKAFFINWAKIWAMKSRPDYAKMLLVSDVHAPNYWRANKQPQNFEQFYQTFDVKPEDRMYLAPEKRVHIW